MKRESNLIDISTLHIILFCPQVRVHATAWVGGVWWHQEDLSWLPGEGAAGALGIPVTVTPPPSCSCDYTVTWPSCVWPVVTVSATKVMDAGNKHSDPEYSDEKMFVLASHGGTCTWPQRQQRYQTWNMKHETYHCPATSESKLCLCSWLDHGSHISLFLWSPYAQSASH